MLPSPALLLATESRCTGRAGSAALLVFGAHAQPPVAETWQSYCSAAIAKGTAKGCSARRLPVTSRGNFLRNAGYFTAILFFPGFLRAIGPEAARLSMGLKRC
ncbi:MAG TPA: hypothetical protein VFE95_04385, partial [Pseudomonas sp.]|nr:hypothetical protein [Pseudomonas sp.]